MYQIKKSRIDYKRLKKLNIFEKNIFRGEEGREISQGGSSGLANTLTHSEETVFVIFVSPHEGPEPLSSIVSYQTIDFFHKTPQLRKVIAFKPSK